MSSGVNQSEDRMLSRATADLERLATPYQGASSYPSPLADGAVRVIAEQASASFSKGKPVVLYDGVWYPYDEPASAVASGLWGIVDRIAGANRFSVIIGGTARIPGASLTPGRWYTFDTNGDPQELFTTGYPPPGYPARYFAIKAVAADRVLVVNDSRIDGLLSHTGLFTTVTHADIGAGHYVVYSGVPSGQSPLAMADEANNWKWTHVGIALFEVAGGPGTWLVLISGEHEWYSYGNGDVRPVWMQTPAYYNGGRTLLSDTTPGQYATAEPSFKVFAGDSSASYAPASPPDNPEYTGFYACAVSQGVVYPIPTSGGGTGTDLSLITDHAVLFADTISGSKKIVGTINAGATVGFLSQVSSGVPDFTYPDVGADKSMEVSAGVLYARVCGKRTAETAPVDKQFLRFNGTTWQPYGPLLMALGETLGHNGTDLVRVDCSTPCSVVGRSASSAGAFAPIAAASNASMLVRNANAVSWLAASADGQILQRRSGALEFSNDPTLTRSGVDFKICSVFTITTSTSAPSASGVKGQMHFIY